MNPNFVLCYTVLPNSLCFDNFQKIPRWALEHKGISVFPYAPYYQVKKSSPRDFIISYPIEDYPSLSSSNLRDLRRRTASGDFLAQNTSKYSQQLDSPLRRTRYAPSHGGILDTTCFVQHLFAHVAVLDTSKQSSKYHLAHAKSLF